MAEHVPVLLEECIEMLNIRPDGIYLDGTLGLGGHSAAIAARLAGGRLIGIDRDETALQRAGERLKPWKEHVTLVHSSFGKLDAVLEDLGIPAVDGMLFDLGVSSPQLDEAERGFSYRMDAPLDMRMDRTQSLTARDVVNRYDEAELSRILFQYGEERYARRIAAAIVRRRAEKEIGTTGELAELIRAAMPAPAMMTLIPLSSAPLAQVKKRSGSLCAEIMCIS
jgi:16S rRNA (cytosine1402-N4)-methyltransferase